ncbi:MAG: polyhydroxyalkanoate depolymerase [Candidatus Puniceispirillaceae bacterium]
MYTIPSYQLLDSSIKLQKAFASQFSHLFDQAPGLTRLHPFGSLMNGWSKVAEKSLERMDAKPEWSVEALTTLGESRPIKPEIILDRAFCALTKFATTSQEQSAETVMIIAPMSGHYATLTRNTVASLVPDCDVYVTDWKNARDVPNNAGSFNLDDFVDYIVDFITYLGPITNVLAICQPAPLTVAATARLALDNPAAMPKSVTLMGGPVDPAANPSAVSNYAGKTDIPQLQSTAIMPIDSQYAGAGRLVYPGILQLTAFMSMNAATHIESFVRQVCAESDGTAHDGDRHNSFYNEYLAVMDMPAEFFLDTVQRIFKDRDIATNNFVHHGQKLDIGAVRTTRLLVIEGGRDDISAPGQCKAALGLFTGLPDTQKHHILEEGAGHYGIFSGKAWRNNIRPKFLDFIRQG